MLDGQIDRLPERGADPIAQVRVITLRLERTRAEREANMNRLEKDYQDAQARGVRGTALQGYKDRLDKFDAASSQAVGALESELESWKSEVDAQLAARRQAAAHELSMQKAAAQKAWLDHGGTQGDFEAAWPSMETDILRQAVLTDNFELAVQRKRIEGGYSL